MKLYLWPIISVFALVFTACSSPEASLSIPKSPLNVVATSGIDATTVTWQDRSKNEDGFVIYRDTVLEDNTTSQSLSVLTTLGANNNTFEDQTAIAGQRYIYYVAAKNNLGESDPVKQQGGPVRLRPSFEVIVGSANINTWHYPVPVTAYLMLVHDESAKPSANTKVVVTVKGPQGWNNDNPYTFTTSASEFGQDFVHISYHIDLMSGSYEVTAVVNGQTYTSLSIVDASSKLATSKVDMNLTGTKQADVNWQTVEGALSYRSLLWASDVSMAGQKTLETSSTFKDLNLGPATYTGKVFSFNYDTTSEYPERPFPQFEMSISESLGSLVAFSGNFVKVDPKGRFLEDDEGILVDRATMHTLVDLGMAPGTCIGMMREGTFASSMQAPDVSWDMIGVFKGSSGYLMPGSLGNQKDVFTAPTVQGKEVDIAEDFMIPARLIVLQVPAGASHLLLSADDIRHRDNSDPDNDFGIRITNVPCPEKASINLVSLGISEQF